VRLDPQPDSMTAMTDDKASQAETLPTWTRLIDSDFGRTIRLTNSYKPFSMGTGSRSIRLAPWQSCGDPVPSRTKAES
jgi:hypothetical protein